MEKGAIDSVNPFSFLGHMFPNYSADENARRARNLAGAYLKAFGYSLNTAVEATKTAFPLMPNPASVYINTLADCGKKMARFFVEMGQPIKRKGLRDLECTIEQTYNEKSQLLNCTDRDSNYAFLIGTPEASHEQAAHLGEGKSVVQMIRDEYSGDCYLLNELPAKGKHTDYGFADMVNSFADSIEHIYDKTRSPVDLFLQCSATWRGMCAASLVPDKVGNIVLVAGPGDYHAGDPQITRMAKSIPDAAIYMMLLTGMGNMPGFYIRQGFQSMNPVTHTLGRINRYWGALDDEAKIKKIHDDDDWFFSTQPLAGQGYLEVKRAFENNPLVKGEVIIDRNGQSHKIDFLNIKGKYIGLVSAEKDNITPPEQVKAWAKYLPDNNIELIMIENAGHLGAISGRKAIAGPLREIVKKVEKKRQYTLLKN